MRSQNVSRLPWKDVALSIPLWLSGLTVDVRAMLTVKKRAQILQKVLIFLLREESILEQKTLCFGCPIFHSAVTEERRIFSFA